MTEILIQRAASYRIDEIYRYTLEKWGKAKADEYIEGMFDSFGKIDTHEVLSRPIPAELGVEGFFFRYQKHFIYWKYLSNLIVGIVTILYERMHQIDRFKGDFGG
ncbi:type II toxin-antitoxin system RelE/ParE family toxin [Desulfobacterota bacterium M19]